MYKFVKYLYKLNNNTDNDKYKEYLEKYNNYKTQKLVLPININNASNQLFSIQNIHQRGGNPPTIIETIPKAYHYGKENENMPTIFNDLNILKLNLLRLDDCLPSQTSDIKLSCKDEMIIQYVRSLRNYPIVHKSDYEGLKELLDTVRFKMIVLNEYIAPQQSSDKSIMKLVQDINDKPKENKTSIVKTLQNYTKSSINEIITEYMNYANIIYRTGITSDNYEKLFTKIVDNYNTSFNGIIIYATNKDIEKKVSNDFIAVLIGFLNTFTTMQYLVYVLLFCFIDNKHDHKDSFVIKINEATTIYNTEIKDSDKLTTDNKIKQLIPRMVRIHLLHSLLNLLEIDDFVQYQIRTKPTLPDMYGNVQKSIDNVGDINPLAKNALNDLKESDQLNATLNDNAIVAYDKCLLERLKKEVSESITVEQFYKLLTNLVDHNKEKIIQPTQGGGSKKNNYSNIINKFGYTVQHGGTNLLESINTTFKNDYSNFPEITKHSDILKTVLTYIHNEFKNGQLDGKKLVAILGKLYGLYNIEYTKFMENKDPILVSVAPAT